eukprot:763281-Hanusia_phi.AAC.1
MPVFVSPLSPPLTTTSACLSAQHASALPGATSRHRLLLQVWLPPNLLRCRGAASGRRGEGGEGGEKRLSEGEGDGGGGGRGVSLLQVNSPPGAYDLYSTEETLHALARLIFERLDVSRWLLKVRGSRRKRGEERRKKAEREEMGLIRDDKE